MVQPKQNGSDVNEDPIWLNHTNREVYTIATIVWLKVGPQGTLLFGGKRCPPFAIHSGSGAASSRGFR